MKKVSMILGLALAGLGVYAQQEAQFDLTAAGQAATQIATSAQTVLTGDVRNAALMVLAALVGLWFLLKIPRWVGLGRK